MPAGQLSGPFRRDEPKIRQVSPHVVIDRLRPLAHKQIACTEHHSPDLLLFRLHGHEAHGRPLRRLARRLRVRREECFCRLTNWLHIYRRNQLAWRVDAPASRRSRAPVVSARTGLHRHHAGRLRGEELKHLPSAQPGLSEHDGPVRPSTVKLKAVLRQIDRRSEANLISWMPSPSVGVAD